MSYVGPTHRVDADSDCRQSTPTADLSFYYFSNPPIPLVVSSVCVALYRCACLLSHMFPVGSSVERALRGGHVCEAPRVVLRGFVVLPLFTQGQHYVFYLFFATGGGGSVLLITVHRHRARRDRSASLCFLRKGQLNRHTRHRPATTTRNTATQWSCGSADLFSSLRRHTRTLPHAALFALALTSACHVNALLPHRINTSMSLEILGVTIPSPYLWVLAFWVFLVLVIADAGGGFPIYFPLLRPFFRPFQPRAVYARLKSKYVVES